MTSQIRINLSPEGLNSFLIKKYGIGLHPLAHILGCILVVGDVSRYERFPSAEILANLKMSLVNLKKKLISIMSEVAQYEMGEFWVWKGYKENRKEIEGLISDKYKLNYFFEKIAEISKLIDRITKERKSGSFIRKRNLTASVWALLLKEKRNRLEWDLIADILDWFWNKLKDSKIYAELNPENEISNPANLKNQFYRNKNKYISTFLKFKTGDGGLFEDSPFFYGNSTIFFGKRALIKWGQSVFMHFYKNILLHKKDFISIYDSILSEEIDFPEVTNNQIRDAYIYYFGKIYKNNPSSPPLIIFPDLSYLC